MNSTIQSIKETLGTLNQEIECGDCEGAWVCDETKGAKQFPSSRIHKIYRGLSPIELDRLQVLVDRKFPAYLRDFYEAANGLYLFYGSLSVGGLVGLDGYEPISLEYGTTMDRPMEGGKFIDNSDQIRFGGYGIDEIDLMIYVNDPRVFAVRRFREGPIYYEWPDMKTMLISEVNRMLELYRENPAVGPLRPFPAPWM